MRHIQRQTAIYPPFMFGRRGVCTYCGESADSRDHVLAVSYLTFQDRRKHSVKGIGPQTHCCPECNRILGNRYFDTFRLRCLYVYDSLVKKAGKASAEWSERELRQIGYTLQSFVRHQQYLRRWYLLRSEWFMSDEYYLTIEGLNYECFLIETHPKFHCEYSRYFRDTITGINRCLDSRQARERD